MVPRMESQTKGDCPEYDNRLSTSSKDTRQEMKALSVYHSLDKAMVHPYKFKLKWQLTWDELSEATGRDRRTLLRYRTNPNPDDTVQILCSALDALWGSANYLEIAGNSGLFVPQMLRGNRRSA